MAVWRQCSYPPSRWHTPRHSTAALDETLAQTLSPESGSLARSYRASVVAAGSPGGRGRYKSKVQEEIDTCNVTEIHTVK